jgi:hypothetical protein
VSLCPVSPATAPSPPTTASSTLVPAGASSVLLCEYQTLNPPIGLARSALVTDQVTIERLTAEADAGVRPPPGTAQSRPVDLGTIADLYFDYRAGIVVLLEVDDGG